VFSPADDTGPRGNEQGGDSNQDGDGKQGGDGQGGEASRPDGKSGGYLASTDLPHHYSRTTDLSEFRNRANAATLAFYDYWDGKRRGRAMPARADLDPVEMVSWLKCIQIIEVFHNPRRLKYRLVGELEVESRGFNPTGRWVEDGFIGLSKDDVLHNYNAVIDGRGLLYDWGEYVCGGGYLRWQETIFLPLSSDGDTIDRVITYTVTRGV
jgi:hypothetical protein